MSRTKSADKQKGSVRRNVDWKALQIVHSDAAGIDVGGSEHWVAISPDRDPEPVRRFGCFTADLRELGRWLVGLAGTEGGFLTLAYCTQCQGYRLGARKSHMPLGMMWASGSGQ